MFNRKMPTGEYYLANWYEYTAQVDLDSEDGSWTDIPAEFRYKQYIDDAGTRYPMPGMRTTSGGLELTIETTNDYAFKEMDKIKFSNGKILKIKTTSKNRQRSNSMAAFQFPGAVDDYASTIIVLYS